MTKQVRDWHKDMELVNNYKFSQTLHNEPKFDLAWKHLLPEPEILVLEYWLQQYAAEKERADRFEQRNMVLLGANQMYQVDLAESLAREKKLRETLERILKMTNKSEAYTTEARVYHEAFKTLSSLYPKEEEAK